jgi:lipid-A-disaccharide synthase
MYARELILELEKISPGTKFFGLGGNRMEEVGFRSLIPISEISLVGFSEVIPKLGVFVKLLRQIRENLEKEKPELVILIDYPGLNLRIARIAKQLDIPVLYYIAPQLWAWGKRRLETIRKYIDRVAVIMPFEVDYYRSCGVNVDYVGHPILEALTLKYDKQANLQSMGIDKNRKVLGILPGVRNNELKNLLPPLTKIAEKLISLLPEIEVVFSLPDGSSIFNPAERIRSYAGDSHELIACCDCLLTKSGTAVLEAAVLGIPMIVCYRLSWLNYLLARMFIQTRYISLVNLLMDSQVVPEFVQGDVNQKNIIPIVEELLDPTSSRRRSMIENFEEVRDKLGKHRTSAEVAEIAYSMIVSGR